MSQRCRQVGSQRRRPSVANAVSTEFEMHQRFRQIDSQRCRPSNAEVVVSHHYCKEPKGTTDTSTWIRYIASRRILPFAGPDVSLLWTFAIFFADSIWGDRVAQWMAMGLILVLTGIAPFIVVVMRRHSSP